MQIDLIRAGPHHRRLLRQLYELYCHDFSPMTKSDIGDDGLFTADDFLSDWPADLDIFLIQVDGQWAGFAWMARGSYIDPTIDDHYLMDEFFVMRKYRSRHIGEQAAVRLFSIYSGTWEVGEILENVDAQVFWRKVIGRYTDDHFDEVTVDNERWHGPVQVFITPSPW
jgi:predicted acetyltransferase